MAYVRRASVADAADLAPRLRPEDSAELLAASGLTSQQALLEAVLVTESFAIVHAGRVIALFGCGPDPANPDIGIVWMVGSQELSQIARQFMRESRDYINGLLSRYAAIGNWVDERNTEHIRWLKFNGFSFINRSERFGFEQRPFLEFVKCAIPSLSPSPSL